MIIDDIPCRWWLTPVCPDNATHLIIIICGEGHLRERLLCQAHIDITHLGITCNLWLCPEKNCDQTLARHMTVTPIETHWHLAGAVNDTQPIPNINDPDSKLPYIVHANHFKRILPVMPPQCNPWLGVTRELTPGEPI